MNLSRDVRPSLHTAAVKGNKISWIFHWILKTYSTSSQPMSGLHFHSGHRSHALLFGLSLVDELSQVLNDGRWLLVDHSPVCSFYVKVIGWWIGFLQKPLLKFRYHLVQGEYDYVTRALFSHCTRLNVVAWSCAPTANILTWFRCSGICSSKESPVSMLTDILLERGLNFVISLLKTQKHDNDFV